MEFNDFEFAPSKQVIDNLRPVPIDPNKQVIDNLRPVPIDIYKLEAKVVCDVSIRKCKVISKMYFKI